MKWFKDYTDYEKLWTLGEIGIEDVPDDYLFSKGKNVHHNPARPKFAFSVACDQHMKVRREAREVQ